MDNFVFTECFQYRQINLPRKCIRIFFQYEDTLRTSFYAFELIFFLQMRPCISGYCSGGSKFRHHYASVLGLRNGKKNRC